LNPQKLFFEMLSNKLEVHENMVDVVSDLLSVSRDSSYRRIRGETALIFDEMILLAAHFEISIDAIVMMKDQFQTVNFHYQRYGINFLDYLEFIEREFKMYKPGKDFQIIYSAKDYPSHYNFLFPELAVFKAFFYTRVLWGDDVMDDYVFDFERIFELLDAAGLKKTGDRIISYYLQRNSTEIWNVETLNGQLNQLRYCWESGLFKDKANALLILRKTREMISHIAKQAAKGYKFLPGEIDNVGGNYSMYFIDAVQLEHTIWRESDGSQKTYLLYNTGDYLLTSNEQFCNRTERYLKNLIKKSTLISKTGEKARHQLFNKIKEDIALLISEIE